MKRQFLMNLVNYLRNMAKLLLHETTEYQLGVAKTSLPHAVLISGKTGAGKHAIALELATAALGVDDATTQPYYLEVIPEKSQISINEVRAIRDFLSKKTTGTGTIRRVLFIPNAQTMGNEAQNALLKTLEEPPADTMIILTIDDISSVKATIRSRAQHILCLPVVLDDAIKHYASTYSEPEIVKAYHLSAGQPGLLQALLENQIDHPVVQAIQQAKDILKSNKYERLALIDTFTKDKVALHDIITGLQQVVNAGLRQASESQNVTVAKRYYTIDAAILETREYLQRSGNPKLALTQLFLAM